MLTDPGDSIIDPFAGSCITGEVAERLNRIWICVELLEDYVEGAKGRFTVDEKAAQANGNTEKFYRLARPGLLWNGNTDERLSQDGGKTRPVKLAVDNTQPNGVANNNGKATKSEVVKPETKSGFQGLLW
jgi:DNA methylase